jgi:hypothetical protein
LVQLKQNIKEKKIKKEDHLHNKRKPKSTKSPFACILFFFEGGKKSSTVLIRPQWHC